MREHTKYRERKKKYKRSRKKRKKKKQKDSEKNFILSMHAQNSQGRREGHIHLNFGREGIKSYERERERKKRNRWLENAQAGQP